MPKATNVSAVPRFHYDLDLDCMLDLFCHRNI